MVCMRVSAINCPLGFNVAVWNQVMLLPILLDLI